MIEAKNLTKRYGHRLAVDDLSFTVRPGVVTGFLGPNGAGKSTTMRMILGLDKPTGGSVTVNGRPARGRPAADRPVLARDGPAAGPRVRAARRPPHPDPRRAAERPRHRGIRGIRALLRDFAADGRTVFVSSHLMNEMAMTAEHLVVIGHGRLLADTGLRHFIGSAASLEEAFMDLAGGAR